MGFSGWCCWGLASQVAAHCREQAVAAAERDLGAAIEAHSKAFAALATNPSDQTGKKAAVELSAKMQMRWAEAAARRADLTKSSAAIAAGDTQIAALTPQRDQAKAAVEQLTAKLAEMGPSLQPLKQAAAAAAPHPPAPAAAGRPARWTGSCHQCLLEGGH